MVYFIDDVNMAHRDEYDIQSANELLRQWFDHQGWFDINFMSFKKIKDVSFCATVSIGEFANSKQLSNRFEWHWAAIGYTNYRNTHIE